MYPDWPRLVHVSSKTQTSGTIQPLVKNSNCLFKYFDCKSQQTSLPENALFFLKKSQKVFSMQLFSPANAVFYFFAVQSALNEQWANNFVIPCSPFFFCLNASSTVEKTASKPKQPTESKVNLMFTRIPIVQCWQLRPQQKHKVL